MDYTEPVPAPAIKPLEMAAGEWYLRGFADAYSAHVAVIPAGPAGEQYSKGYTEGLAAVQRDIFAEIWT